MNKAVFLSAILIVTLVGLLSTGLQAVNFTDANPIPEAYAKLTIDSSSTYTTDTFTINFSVETNWSYYTFFYSLDGSEKMPIDNMIIVSKEGISGHEPAMYKTILNGNCTLSSLSEGYHTLTVYQISHYSGDPQYGGKTYSANTQFKINTTSTPHNNPSLTASLTPTTAAINTPTQQQTLKPTLTDNIIDSPTTSYPQNTQIIITTIAIILIAFTGLLSYYILKIYFKKI